MTPDEYRKEFGHRAHPAVEAQTDPVSRIVVIEGLSLEDYRDDVLAGQLDYRIKERPVKLGDRVYTRLFVAGFGPEGFQGFKPVEARPARRHLRVSEIFKGEKMTATTAHEDYTGWNIPRLILSHLPQFVPSPPRITGDYQTGEDEFIRALEELGI